jgi:hypothetical protein
MMTDKRELILERLLEIAAEVLGTEHADRAYRNKVDIPDERDMRPAIVILEGDEKVDDNVPGRKRPASGPRIVQAIPHVFILAGGRPEDVGTNLNLLRAALISAVLRDVSLSGLAHEGQVNYEGMATGLAAGRSMRGEANLVFSIPYVMRPNDL